MINNLLILLLLINSNLAISALLKMRQPNIIIPNSEYLRIATKLNGYCIGYGTPGSVYCNSNIPSMNFKVTDNKDGSYLLQNQFNNQYFDGKTYSASPVKTFLTPHPLLPKFFIFGKPKCSDNAGVTVCNPFYDVDLFWFDDRVYKIPVQPDSFYNLIPVAYKYSCLLARDVDYPCSFDTAEFSYKFVFPDKNQTAMIIDGFGRAITQHDQSTAMNTFYAIYQGMFEKPVANSKFQRFIVNRNPMFPYLYEFVSKSVSDKSEEYRTALYASQLNLYGHGSDWENYYLTPGCSRKKFDNSKWFFIFSDKLNYYVNTKTKTMEKGELEFSDNFLFKFELDEKYKLYRIINKELGSDWSLSSNFKFVEKKSGQYFWDITQYEIGNFNLYTTDVDSKGVPQVPTPNYHYSKDSYYTTSIIISLLDEDASFTGNMGIIDENYKENEHSVIGQYYDQHREPMECQRTGYYL